MKLSRLSRLTSILIHLQSKRLITATALANRFEVSVRTIYRDIRTLEEAGIPIIVEEGKGYALMKGYSLPPVMFTQREANALITAGKMVARNKDASFIKDYSSAITKIKAVLRYSDQDKTELLAQRTAFLLNFGTHTTSDHLSTIQLGITNFKCLQLEYQSLQENVFSSRIVEPMALYNTQENWVLIAWCRLRKAMRQFRLDRIQKMYLLEDAFLPHDFNLKNYFLSFNTKSEDP